MAILLDSITIPRATLTTTTTTSAVYSPLPSSSSTLSTVKFSEFKGLKLSSANIVTRSVNSLSVTNLRRRSSSSFRVAAESSETTFQLPAISESEWKSLVLESELPVMAEFWAPWCGPCRMVQPLIDELAIQYAGKLKVYKVNTDECPNIASEYGIRSIPTVIIFKNGEKKDSIIGAVPKSTLTTNIEKYL